MNDVAIKKERTEESATADDENLSEDVGSLTTESSAKECLTTSVAEHDALPQVAIKLEPQVETQPVQKSSHNAETQPDDCAKENANREFVKSAEIVSSESQPVGQLIRVKPEPSNATDSTNQPNTNENNLNNTLENIQAFTEADGSATPTQDENEAPTVFTEPVESVTLIQESAKTVRTLAESIEGSVNSRNGALPDNEADEAQQTFSQSFMEKSITAAAKTTTVSVKPEPVSGIPETIPDDFFDDLLDNADQLTAELSPPEQHSQASADVSEATQCNANALNNYVIKPASSAPNQDSACERVRIKNEPLGLSERYEQPAGDELDNISTPRASPQRLALEEEISSSTPARTQVRVKNEVNHEMESGCNEEETIPDNFFDDLLDDRVAARVARMENEFEELKYAEQLKAIREKLRRLEEPQQDSDDARDKSSSSTGHKHKSKKSKKKSRKRARSRERRKESEGTADNGESRYSNSKRRRSRSKTNEREELGIETPQFNTNYGNLPKVPPPPPAYSQSTSTLTAHLEAVANNDMRFPKPIMVKPEPAINFEPMPVYPDVNMEDEDMDLDCLPVQISSTRTTINDAVNDAFSGFKKIKLEKPASEPAKPLILTPAMKRQKALQLAGETIQQFQGAKSQPSFYFASTVRKLPTSSSFVAQQSYENRSPLHTIHNVRYTFNSHSTRFNLHEWGLEALPKIAAKVARIVGCDADTLCAKLHSAKLSTKYNKIKREPDDNSELIDETKSSFFTNAMTQTDDVYVLTARRRNANDIGVQVTPINGSVGTQTTATSSSMASTNDDLPLMQLINVLNENQLLALNDFAELIREPAETAIDMYRLRTRMLEIYKCSQLPSAMSEAPIAVPSRTYEAAPRRLPNATDHRQQQQQPQQHRLASRDPRASSSSFATHAVYGSDLRAQVDPRLNPAAIHQQREVQYQGLPPQHRQLHPAAVSAHAIQQQQREAQYQGLPPQHRQLHPSAAGSAAAPTKSYGRGSVRR